jgi:hypothetical protein
VRDAAAVACGRVLLAYPDVCAPFLPELLELWVAHLWDNVQVRTQCWFHVRPL